MEGAAIVRRTDNGEIFQISDRPIDSLMQPIDAYEDRTVLSFHRDDVDTLRYREGIVNITIRQDDGTSEGVRTWIPVNPSNYSLELRRTWFMVNTLADLEAEERSSLTPEEAGIIDSRNSIRITFHNGTYQDLVIGRATRNRRGGPAWFVSVNGTSPVFIINESELNTLKAGFGR